MIDLKATYGGTYRIAMDSSAALTGQTREERLWLYRIPCGRGHIYVHGANTLGAFCDRPNVGRRLMALPGVRVHQRGDREFTVVFPADNGDIFSKVAELLKARKRRKITMTEEQRTALAERLARHRRTKGESSLLQVDSGAQDASATGGTGPGTSAPVAAPGRGVSPRFS